MKRQRKSTEPAQAKPKKRARRDDGEQHSRDHGADLSTKSLTPVLAPGPALMRQPSIDGRLSLLDLASDVVTLVAKLLDPPSLASFSLACKPFHSRFFDSNMWGTGFSSSCFAYGHVDLFRYAVDVLKSPVRPLSFLLDAALAHPGCHSFASLELAASLGNIFYNGIRYQSFVADCILSSASNIDQLRAFLKSKTWTEVVYAKLDKNPAKLIIFPRLFEAKNVSTFRLLIDEIGKRNLLDDQVLASLSPEAARLVLDLGFDPESDLRLLQLRASSRGIIFVSEDIFDLLVRLLKNPSTQAKARNIGRVVVMSDVTFPASFLHAVWYERRTLWGDDNDDIREFFLLQFDFAVHQARLDVVETLSPFVKELNPPLQELEFLTNVFMRRSNNFKKDDYMGEIVDESRLKEATRVFEFLYDHHPEYRPLLLPAEKKGTLDIAPLYTIQSPEMIRKLAKDGYKFNPKAIEHLMLAFFDDKRFFNPDVDVIALVDTLVDLGYKIDVNSTYFRLQTLFKKHDAQFRRSVHMNYLTSIARVFYDRNPLRLVQGLVRLGFSPIFKMFRDEDMILFSNLFGNQNEVKMTYRVKSADLSAALRLVFEKGALKWKPKKFADVYHGDTFLVKVYQSICKSMETDF